MDFLDISFIVMLFITVGMYTGKRQYEESHKKKHI